MYLLLEKDYTSLICMWNGEIICQNKKNKIHQSKTKVCLRTPREKLGLLEQCILDRWIQNKIIWVQRSHVWKYVLGLFCYSRALSVPNHRIHHEFFTVLENVFRKCDTICQKNETEMNVGHATWQWPKYFSKSTKEWFKRSWEFWNGHWDAVEWFQDNYQISYSWKNSAWKSGVNFFPSDLRKQHNTNRTKILYQRNYKKQLQIVEALSIKTSNINKILSNTKYIA